MPTYKVRPNQRVSHGSDDEAIAHFARMRPGQTLAQFPPAPVRDYEEGDEVELTEEQAAQMPWAVCTLEEFEQESSPKAFMAKGYTRDEAESMAASLKVDREERIKARKAKTARSAIPGPPALPGGGMAPTDGSTEANPRVAGRFPDDSLPKREEPRKWEESKPDEHKKPAK